MRKISSPELSLIAHYEIARAMEKDLPKMMGFSSFWFKQLSDADRHLILKYEAIRQKAYVDLSAFADAHEPPKKP